MPTSTQHSYPLPYFADSAALFAPLAAKPWAIFLDSGHPLSCAGRFDILAAEPICTLVTYGDCTTITYAGNSKTSTDNPFDLVQEKLRQFAPTGADSDLPFNGGAMGYFAYDLGRRLEKLPTIAENAEHTPDMAIGIYLWAVIVDHERQQSHLCCPAEMDASALLAQFSQLPETQPQQPFRVLGAAQSNMSESDYRHAFQRIKTYLKEGDCYQVNLAQRFAAPCDGEPWTAYLLLRELNAAPFSAYLNIGDVQVLSSSPERFLKLTQRVVETKPIKGTRPRKSDDAQDALQIQHLQNSTKDRAENLMIVDLLRNDISKTCRSVKVPELFAIETYSTVHHLVSTISGELAADKHALDLLKSCFPGGSITGAPKIRAMEIIEELEPHQRGIYCGAIGYIGLNGNMDTNIAIRTLVYSENILRFWAGGGIVHDSRCEEEYQECFDKAAALLAVCERLREKT